MSYDKQLLAKAALNARENAYAPYSNYAVGAALLAKCGEVFTGCNVENVSYGATNCAERTAVFKAVSEGVTSFKAIAVAGGFKDKTPPLASFAQPCGICRQVLFEFCDESFSVLFVKSETDFEEHTLGELLPLGFGPREK